MANREHLSQLFHHLRGGAEAWNSWRKDNSDIDLDFSSYKFEGMLNQNLYKLDFTSANLTDADFSGCNLSGANLSGSRLWGADLRGASLDYSNLDGAELYRADLGNATLMASSLVDADLSFSNLTHAILDNARLSGAKLNEVRADRASFKKANLAGARFVHTLLSYSDLSEANLDGAVWCNTVFGETDLNRVAGLDSCVHAGPSILDNGTLEISKALPLAFLRGCGLSDWQIENAKLYQADLGNEEITNILYRVHALRATQAIQISPLFISYSRADSAFINRLEPHLNDKGVRFWRDVHHATAGRLETQIDRAIRFNSTVLLVLSEHSVKSDWVQHEARLARNLELETKRDVLCPVALDDSWKNCKWPERLREQIMEYNILDFSEWRDENKFWRMFSRLLEGLDLFYK